MKRKTKLIVSLVIGIILALGPFWGMIGTVAGMIAAFNSLGHQPSQPDALATNISLALYATLAGWLACPVGLTITIISGIKLNKGRDAATPHPDNE